MRYKVIFGMIFILIIVCQAGFGKTAAPVKKNVSTDEKALLKDFINTYYISTNDSKDWIVKIESNVIGKEEFDNGFQYLLSQVPENQKATVDEKTMKKQYLNGVLMQNIVLMQAMEDDLFSSDDANIVLKSALRQTIYQIYLNKALPKDKQRFTPTDDEINKYYEQNKERLLQMGLNADQIKQYASQELSQQKIQVWVQEYLEKLKENYRIKRNQDAMKKEGLD